MLLQQDLMFRHRTHVIDTRALVTIKATRKDMNILHTIYQALGAAHGVLKITFALGCAAKKVIFTIGIHCCA
jgi:hypothetical protein